MTLAPTPPATASEAVSSLGIMPPLIVPSSTRRSTSSVPRASMRSPDLSRTPATSVRSRRRSAPRALATAPAAVSALMLYDDPSSIPTPIGAMTGMAPTVIRSSRMRASTRVGSPTRPRSALALAPDSSTTQCSICVAPMSPPPACPVRPTAFPPAREMAFTTLLFTRPPSTISTTSMVRSSVTRRPSTNLLSTLRSLSMAEIWGPPP
mmetsp:Transcript_20242/g.54492  ORF Transcript_20242/g.54492 Transcript_20242/m.54492 type:complete len:208 (-) Transcript_20242:137-760(-)